MKDKLSFLFIYLILISTLSFSDNTNDYQPPLIKFRGTVSFVWDYLFEIQDGVNPGNHYLPINYSPLDYTDAGDPAQSHHNTTGRVIGGTWGGTQFETYLDYHFIIPVLNFDTPLTRGNNLKFSLHGQLSPITLNNGFSITLTPVAFLTLQTGFIIGFGWNIPDFAAGFGINENGRINRLAIGGPLVQFWVSSTFQFDLAVLMPPQYQKWTHVVMLLTPTIKYQALLGIGNDQPYMYQECPGEKLNGFKFLGEFLLGYRFYLIEDDIGENQRFLKHKNKNLILTLGMYAWIDYLNLTHYADSPIANGWGSDFCYINFGPAIQIDLPYNMFVKLFFFFQNDKSYTAATTGNLDFRDRIYEDWYVYFRWCGLFFGVNF